MPSDLELDDEPAATSDGKPRPNSKKPKDDEQYETTANELKQFIEQWEQCDAEKKDITERQKEIMAEARARGYDTKVMKQVIAIRKQDADQRAEEEAILDMYLVALGLM